MNVETFFDHYQIARNPFAAEEARLDPVFEQLAEVAPAHPDFDKILGDLRKPSTAIVFGEKGSGKTAIRLLIGRTVTRHNREHSDARLVLVPYDDLNSLFDNLLKAGRQDVKQVLKHLRLADHQDGMLSLAVTRLVSGILKQTDSQIGEDDEPSLRMPTELKRIFKQMPRHQRMDLATLALLYDQPKSGDVEERFSRLRAKLRLTWRLPMAFWRNLGVLMAIVSGGLWLTSWLMGEDRPGWIWLALVLAIAAAVMSLGFWAWRGVDLWRLARRVHREMPAVGRSAAQLRRMLAQMPRSVLRQQPLPAPSRQGKPASDQRYQLTRELIDAIDVLGYHGMVVLVDRVDEPTLISGEVERMKATVWPMLDNKFLQQRRVGVKLLLPLELRHLLYRESPAFFQEARLDKQNLVDRLSWTGTMLFDLCQRRLRACGNDQASLQLTDLFAEDVSRTLLIDCLNEMQQPRDAFKFLYMTIQEHCKVVPEGENDFKIARLTLETVRRTQAQRVQEFQRGLTPA